MQFQEAAQQRDADDIADVLDVQAADAEDAQVDEELEQSEGAAASGLANSAGGALSKDSFKQAAKTGLQAASDAASQVGGAVTKGVTGGNAAGKTKDAHEADLDLTHTDKAPGTQQAQNPSSPTLILPIANTVILHLVLGPHHRTDIAPPQAPWSSHHVTTVTWSLSQRVVDRPCRQNHFKYSSYSLYPFHVGCVGS